MRQTSVPSVISRAVSAERPGRDLSAHSDAQAKPLVGSAAPAAGGTNPLFGVAMLKIALELKKEASVPIEDLVARVARKMHLDETAFGAFLKHNAALLSLTRSAASSKGEP